MPHVLGTHWSETRPYVDQLPAGTPVERIGIDMDMSAGFAGEHVRLLRYPSIRTGEPVWVVEIERFAPPDAQWWDSIMLDDRPSLAAIAALVGGRKVSAGDTVEGVH